MNRVKTRTITALVLVAAMLAGLLFYVFTYLQNGAEWASFQANRNVYTNGLVLTGSVVDRNGTVLTSARDGSRWYHADDEIRKATLHVVGDRSGNIGTSVLNRYSSQLIGYDPINGVYSLSDRGGTVQLSIDAEVSRVALEALNGASGTIAVYNYKTGEILCMVSSPTFDPDHEPDLSSDTAGYEGVYLNRAISSTFTPGSIFKLVTAAAAIENIEGLFDMRFDCPGSIEVDGKTINCHSTHGSLSLGNALAVSCNCAFAEIALMLGSDTLAQYAKDYGLTESFSMDSIAAAAGNYDLHEDDSWELAWSGIGQSTDLVNPLAFLRLMGAYANEGVAVTPRFVLSVTGASGIRTTITPQTSERLVNAKTANAMRELMAYNVTANYGTANYPGLDLCAKSGTAEVGGDAQPHAWFAGFLRNEDAPLAFVVLIENGGSGSKVAGAAANRVLQAAVAAVRGS